MSIQSYEKNPLSKSLIWFFIKKEDWSGSPSPRLLNEWQKLQLKIKPVSRFQVTWNKRQFWEENLVKINPEKSESPARRFWRSHWKVSQETRLKRLLVLCCQKKYCVSHTVNIIASSHKDLISWKTKGKTTRKLISRAGRPLVSS